MENRDTQEVKETSISEVQQTNSPTNELLLQKIEQLSKQFQDLKNNRFDSSEIKAIAKQKELDRNGEMEEGFLESDKIQKLIQKGQTDLQIRNAIWDKALNDFLEGDVPNSFFKSIDSKAKSEHSHLLGACLYRYLAPKYGVSLNYLDSTSMIQAEKEFNWKNQPGNLVRTFRG